MRYFAYIILLWLFYGCSSKAKNGLEEVSDSYAKAPLLCRLDTTFTEIDMRQKKSSDLAKHRGAYLAQRYCKRGN